jgi:mono/diheme cytochrome c family protein
MPKTLSFVRLLLALLVGAACAAPVAAADLAHGQTIYTTYCATCHNPGGNPGPDFIRKGAGDPSVLGIAFRTVLEMEPFETLLSTTDVVDLAAYLAVKFGVTPVPQTAAAIEYYHAAFDHFFVTTVADEIAKLDNGTFVGWQRTGLQFDVYKAPQQGTSAVCRFFSTAFAPKSSHFYTASPSECDAVKANPSWTFEGEVFYVVPPDDDGSCATGTIPVYRVYNDGMGAAPNHRLITDPALQSEMVTRGWVPEGQGVGVTMCVPMPDQ